MNSVLADKLVVAKTSSPQQVNYEEIIDLGQH
jgi:hypothetical protein